MKLEKIELAFKDKPIAKKVAYMIATSHEYKKPNELSAIKLVSNYDWTEGKIKPSDLQGINKPVIKEKVFEIAKNINEKNMTPLMVVNKFQGITPQSPGKKILLDGHHRKEAAELKGLKEVPIYYGKYNGNAEKTINELVNKEADELLSDFFEKTANIFSKRDLSNNIHGQNLKFITGFSGSGKTTLAEQIEKKNPDKNIMIEIDGFQHGYDTTGKYKVVDNFIKDNGLYVKENSNVNIQKIIKYIEETAKNNPNNNYIVEGIQISEMPNDFFEKYPITAKGTGLIESSLRRVKRSKMENNLDNRENIIDALKYNIKLNKSINNVRKHLSKKK